MFHSLFPTNIMDPLLTRLQNSGLGLSYSIDIIDYVTGYVSIMLQNSGLGLSLYAGGFIHADDIRTLSSSTESLVISIVESFSKENFLKLNVQKCEIVSFRSGYSLSLSPGCEFTPTNKSSCKMPWLLVAAPEPLS